MPHHTPSDHGNTAATGEYEPPTGGKLTFSENRNRPWRTQIATLPLPCMGGLYADWCSRLVRFQPCASGRDVAVDTPTIPTMRHCPPVRRRRRWPGLSPSIACGHQTANLPGRSRHLGNSSVRCGVQYAKPATWYSVGVAEEGASDSVLDVGDRVSERRGYLGSSILPGTIQYRSQNTVDPRTVWGRDPTSQRKDAQPRACGRSRLPVREANARNDNESERTQS